MTITANVGDFSLTTSNPNLVMKSGASGKATLDFSQIAVGTAGGVTGAV